MYVYIYIYICVCVCFFYLYMYIYIYIYIYIYNATSRRCRMGTQGSELTADQLTKPQTLNSGRDADGLGRRLRVSAMSHA